MTANVDRQRPLPAYEPGPGLGRAPIFLEI